MTRPLSRTESKLQRQTQRLQALIVTRYGQEKIEQLQLELCGNCKFKGSRDSCEHNLLPITLAGDNCFYFITFDEN